MEAKMAVIITPNTDVFPEKTGAYLFQCQSGCVTKPLIHISLLTAFLDIPGPILA